MRSKMNFDASVKALLKAGGYRVDAVRDEEDAVIQAQRKHPDLILVNLGMAVVGVIVAARRIRERANLSEEVPVVIFCVEESVKAMKSRSDRMSMSLVRITSTN
jgi:CheY-like chemotaxis protein